MSATTVPVTTPPRRHLGARIHAVLSSVVAVVLGLAPHVLHHVGPLAGAAIVAGTAGSLLFGAIGLIAAIPFLLRAHRRCGSWRIPAALLALFATVFSVSTFVIGPAISGGGSAKETPAPTQPTPAGTQDDSHSAHHK